MKKHDGEFLKGKIRALGTVESAAEMVKLSRKTLYNYFKEAHLENDLKQLFKDKLGIDFTQNVTHDGTEGGNSANSRLKKRSDNDATGLDTEGHTVTDPTLKSMIESNKVMAHTLSRQVDNNAELIQLLKKKSIDADLQEIQLGVSARFQVLQGFLIQDGIEKKRWKSVEEATAKLNMLIHEMIQKSIATGTHEGEGT